MNNNNDLPLMTNDFQIEVEGSITKRRYIGDFSCKIPNTKEQCLIAKHRAFLNGEYAEHLDLGTKAIHQKIAYLRYTLTEYPKFWKTSDLGYELIDHNVIEAVYNKVMDFEEKWLKQVWGEEVIDGDEEKGSVQES